MLAGVYMNAPTLRDLRHWIRPFLQRQRPSSGQKWRMYEIQSVDFYFISSSSSLGFNFGFILLVIHLAFIVVLYWGLAAEVGSKQRHSERHLCKTTGASPIQPHILCVQLLHHFFHRYKGSYIQVLDSDNSNSRLTG